MYVQSLMVITLGAQATQPGMKWAWYNGVTMKSIDEEWLQILF